VTVLADVRRQDVRRGLTRSLCAVVTADAVVGDVGVIEVGRDPSIGRVAVVAVIAARYMSGVLARGGIVPSWQEKQVPTTWV
jgi:hypothetical protein